MVSVICNPIVSVGFSDVIGSWKIIASSRPRRSSSFFSGSLVSSLPSKTTVPPTIFAGGLGIRPMMESAVTDLPQPDSPTMPSVFPRSSEKLTPSTARTSPSRVKKCVDRSVTSSSATLRLPSARVERVAQAVGDEVRTEDERRDRDRRHRDDVRCDAVHEPALLGHLPPRRVRRADAETDEGQNRLAQDHARQLEEDRDDQHTEGVGEHVTAE